MTEPGDPGLPFGGWLGDLARLWSRQGPVAWDVARQLAIQVATGGSPPPNTDPGVRILTEELGRVAELHVQRHPALERAARPVTVRTVTRLEWVERALPTFRPLFEHLAAAAGVDAGATPGPETDPLGGLLRMVQPVMLGVSAGSMVGHLAQRAFGQHDLPLPWEPGDEVMVVPERIGVFADDWDLPVDDLRMWVVLREVTAHTVLGVPGVRSALADLLATHLRSFRADPDALGERLGRLEVSGGDPTELAEELQRLLADPHTLLGAVTSEEQQRLRPAIDALVATVTGVIDHVVDDVAGHLLGTHGRIAEAMRRELVEASAADRVVIEMLGIHLSRDVLDAGRRFVTGVIERGGPEALDHLWTSREALPTPAELEAPGLWLARIEYL